ncbi:hypothetical protein [Nocardia sp. NPDC019395]|uniref:hypothetical protein n=1 Tax=Nocardia sp. NPDC019395 TaxID=3154686 RepID=UPI0033E44C0D
MARRAARTADNEGFHRVAGRNSGTAVTRIRGKDENGKPAVFSPDDVIFDLLADSHGQLRSISFPTAPDDRAQNAAWMSRVGERIDREFSHYWPATKVATKKQTWVRDPTAQPVPGADVAGTKSCILVITHANPDVFAVAVRTADPPSSPGEIAYPARTIFLGGAEYGRLLAAKKSVLDDVAATPDSPVRMVSCGAGAPEGDAAESAAESMQANGVLREVQAGTDMVFPERDDAGSSVFGVAGRGDSDGNVEPALRIFPAPPRGDTS